MTTPTRIDPRGARFGAAITAVLVLADVALALSEGTQAQLAARIAQPSFLLIVFVAAVFAFGAIAGAARHPYGFLFRKLLRPFLAPPTVTEDQRPPTFAQAVGLFVTAAGIILHLAGVPYGLAIAASAAFVAAFLNSVFDYCLGCQLYVLLVRAGVIGRKATISA